MAGEWGCGKSTNSHWLRRNRKPGIAEMASWVISSVYVSGYMGIVALMFIENVFPPIPSELIMPLAGYVSAQGKLSLAGVIVAGTAGTVLGALPLYYLGHFIDAERLKNFADRHGRWLALSRDDLAKAECLFKG